MPAPDAIVQLVQRFSDNIEDYKSSNYNETQVRREFIDAFFTALGWDVDNKAGYAEAYKDVVHEDKVKVGGATKAPDYSFRIGTTRKFFVEAKKPLVNVQTDIDPAFQLRRYAWSAKLPVSILTDFEEFSVYDGRVAPNKDDKAGVARLLYLNYTQYVEKWDEIAALFSKDAVLKGAFDRFADDIKAKRGTMEVDAAFLAEIEGWRSALAVNLAAKNPQLDKRQLNLSVQKTIDRIIFLRICEDRGIEDLGRLQSLLNGKNVYDRLIVQFRQADERYNSGLFHFEKEKGRDDGDRDNLSLTLEISDDVLRDIISSLYYPAPYAFDVFPADILGQVYEQFLGKVIVLDAKHKATIETKPEVRKAGGVFYTPTYIVDYIVEQTVGKLVASKTPKQVESLHILDPACGSGSFLIGAYQFLLDWHLQFYEKNGFEAYAKGKEPKVYQTVGGYRLTTKERRRILINNIFGVDIDPQAVEVTKLSLLLKMLEGVTQTNLVVGRILPDLGGNIQCGNSLIGPDFYDNRQLTMLDISETYRVNAFDWSRAFPEILSVDKPGFDAVIGNPPWISLTGRFSAQIHNKEEIDYLIRRHRGNTTTPNLYEYFVSQGLSLTCEKGYFSFITPDRLGFNDQYTALRRRILDESHLVSVTYKMPFPNVVVDTLVFLAHKIKPNPENTTMITKYGKPNSAIKQKDLLNNTTHSFPFFEDDQIASFVDRLSTNKRTTSLLSLFETTSGFGGKSSMITTSRVSDSQIKTLKGESIDRYVMRKYFWFEFAPANITGRTTNKTKLGAVPKVLLRKTGNKIIATYEENGIFPEQSLYFLFAGKTKIELKYVLGLLNSKLLNVYFQAKCLTNAESIAQVKKNDLDKIPIRVINFQDLGDVALYNRMIALVEQILTLNQKLAVADSTVRTLYSRQIESTDAQIDNIVYDLYGLTDDEINFVEARSQ